jgi:hypothetical protein
MDTVLVRWKSQARWHFVTSVLHAKTDCGEPLPLSSEATQHQEINTSQIDSFRGLCEKCFHEMCINRQDRRLWEIYYKHIVGDK